VNASKSLTGAQLMVKCLEHNSVKFVFGIPGAKIDALFDALLDSPIRVILCRHEQNAAFMAAAYGRITGEPGVVAVTSGPGVCNLTTGLLTATTEGDPIVAIGGSVSRTMQLKNSHQNTDNTRVMEAATKKSVSINNAENIPEVIENMFRIAKASRKGACFISVPIDVLQEKTIESALVQSRPIHYGMAPESELKLASELISEASLPVLFFGEDASFGRNVEPLRKLVQKHNLPVVSTYQGAGVISRELITNFVGRVGLFKNQPGDKLLDEADLVITVGYNPVEYDPEVWNSSRSKKIIHIDSVPAQIHTCYQPLVEILGDISYNIKFLSALLCVNISEESRKKITSLHGELFKNLSYTPAKSTDGKIHPIDFIHALRTLITDDDLIMCDIGTVYMWMARYFFVYRPRQIFFSNGQQTLGVALPWAIGAKLTCPEKRIFSISGDGGFLFSSMELETAVREKVHFIHFIWTDGTYNMVLEQELLKYNRKSGVDLGKIDIVSYAKAFGAIGFKMNSITDFKQIMNEALKSEVPVLIDIPVDYSSNKELFITLNNNISME